MDKLNYQALQDESLVDIRSQHAFQAGHLKGSLNLNPSNFTKYVKDFITNNQVIVFVISKDNQADLKQVLKDAEELGYHSIRGYIFAEEIPTNRLETVPTISADEFLKLTTDYILLDVRQPAEITRPAPKKNLTTIPFELLPETNNSLDKNKTIYTLCGSGNRSTAAASYLLTQDFKPTVVEGGMKAIQASNQAYETE